MNSPLTIALVGNPNSGKTAVFNALTGSCQRVGNWPGVTVDKKVGTFTHQGETIRVVDLPGAYSTSVMEKQGAVDEKIACQYLLSGEADVVVNVIDGSHLERHLYLTLQLLEKQVPMVLAINMMDIVNKRGLQLNLNKLRALLGCPVVELVAHRQQGIEQLKETIISHRDASPAAISLSFPSEIRQSLHVLTQLIEADHPRHAAWMAQRLLEGDHFAEESVDSNVVEIAKREINSIEHKLGEEPDILIADVRYAFVGDIIRRVLGKAKTPRQTITQYLDRIVLNRYLGIPVFLLVMYMMFVFSINVGGAFQDFFDISSNTIFVTGLSHVLTSWHALPWLTGLLANGVGKGINTTITFIPVIAAMFLFLAFLEDSGYMARAAFVMDRFMRALGLPGKSFVPMIVGFGCNVPAVMGSRILNNRRDRLLTVMMMPFISCGARLAIFAVFASAFFPEGGASIIFALYLLGVVAAVLTGLLLRKTLLRGKPAPLVMELPTYHVPRLAVLSRHMWQRLKGFLRRASRVIIPVCIILGVLNSISVTGQAITAQTKQHSALSSVGRVVTPIFAPMGVSQDNWPATVGLATGILAKEVVVGTLNTLYSQQKQLAVSEQGAANWRDGLRQAALSVPQNLSQLGQVFKNPIAASEAPHDMNKAVYGVMYQAFGSKAAAFAYLLFVLLYFPCVSTMAAMRREIGKAWAYFSVCWSTGLAYALAVMCYQLLTVAAHPVATLSWCVSLLVLLALFVMVLAHYAEREKGSSWLAPKTSELIEDVVSD